MFLFHLITWVSALPLYWLGQLLGAAKSPACLPPLKAAWWIGRDDRMGLAALRKIHQLESPESARLQADSWLAAEPRPGMACFAGLLALAAGDWDNAVRLRDLCRERGGDGEGFIDWLDLQLVNRFNDRQAIEDLYRRLETRKDLTPLVAKTVLDYFLIQAMFAKNWEEAERRAKHLWSIEDNPMAATTLWALNRRRGKAEPLDGYLKNARTTPGQALYCQVLGHFILDELDLARRALDQLRGADAALADSLTKIFAQMGAAL
jgi:hypothetical protein